MTQSNELVIRNVDLIKNDNPVKDLAINIAELEQESKRMVEFLKTKKEELKQKMLELGLKKISFQTGNAITLVTRQNIKVDVVKAQIFLDSTGDIDKYQCLDEKKIKEVFYNPKSNTKYDFIIEDEPTQFVQLK